MRIFSLKKQKVKIGLALGGGGARGFTHLGALKAFEEYGIKFDAVAGTSVGSLVGALYCAGYTFEQMYRIAKEVEVKDIRTSKVFFMPSKTDGLEKIIVDELGDINIEDLKIPFCAVAVDLKTTDEVHLQKGNLAKAVAGSCCVPGVFQPVEFEDKLLCDGGLKNTVPANVLKLMGCDYVVSIDINKSRGYGTDSTKLVDVLACSIRILMKSNVIKGYLYSDVILKPNTKQFKSTRKDGFEDMIDEGYREAVDKIGQIIKLYDNKRISKRIRKRFVEENRKLSDE